MSVLVVRLSVFGERHLVLVSVTPARLDGYAQPRVRVRLAYMDIQQLLFRRTTISGGLCMRNVRRTWAARSVIFTTASRGGISSASISASSRSCGDGCDKRTAGSIWGRAESSIGCGGVEVNARRGIAISAGVKWRWACGSQGRGRVQTA